jgi:hypothetical protein
MKNNLPIYIAKINIVILVVYTIILVGVGLPFYFDYDFPASWVFERLLMWPFDVHAFLPASIDMLRLWGACLVLQWLLPLTTSIVGIILNRTKYLAVHIALIIVIIAILPAVLTLGATAFA